MPVRYKKCAILSKEKIYKSKPVLDVELSGYKIMATLMEAMVDAAANPSRFYSRQLISRVSSQYDIDAPDLETPPDGRHRLYQRHDRRVRARRVPENQRHQPADSLTLRNTLFQGRDAKGRLLALKGGLLACN